MKYKRELNYVLVSHMAPDSFDECIMWAFVKADESNLARLAEAFPKHFATFDSWKRFGLDLSDSEVVV